MPVETELYNILQVSPEASQEEIKKSYRKLALQHHPDKGGDAEIFKKINGAYEILSDPSKRKAYDEGGKNGLNGMPGMDELFEGMFGSTFGNLFNIFGNRGKQSNKTQPIVHTCSVSLEELCERKIKNIRVIRNVVCPCVDKSKVILCSGCSGKGFKVTRVQLAPGILQEMQSVCTTCNGKSKKYNSCSNCKEGIRELPKTFTVHLTPTIKNGHKYVFQEQGNQNHDENPGDFIVIVSFKKHDTYSVDKTNNLFVTVNVSLKDALCGYTLKLIHPSGEEIIKKKDIVNPYEEDLIQNKGLSHEDHLIVKYRVQFPNKLSIDQIDKLKKIL